MSDFIHQATDVNESAAASPNETFAQIASDCWHESNNIMSLVVGPAIGAQLGSFVGSTELKNVIGPELRAMSGAAILARPVLVGLVAGYATINGALTAGCVLDRYHNRGAEWLLMAM